MNSVCKWGGSSLASGKRALNVANFIKTNNLSIVVLSAPGKMSAQDEKITDLFIKIVNNPNKINEILQTIKNRFVDITKTLQVNIDINSELTKIKSTFTKTKDSSHLISRGEYLMAKIFAKHLNYQFIDSKNIIKFDQSGKLLDKTYILIKQSVDKYKKVVIPGFYGSYKNKIKIFSRGGSDITGAIVAKALNTDYTNYTDVDGVYNNFPLTNRSKKLRSISYNDMKFLGLFGFSVLHHKCCDILKDTTIKTHIKSTFEPEKRPTTLSNTQTRINASTKKEFVMAQANNDIYHAFLDKKIYVYFRFYYQDKYFYLLQKENSNNINNCIFYNVIVSAIVSQKPIKNAFYLGDNHYLSITKKE